MSLLNRGLLPTHRSVKFNLVMNLHNTVKFMSYKIVWTQRWDGWEFSLDNDFLHNRNYPRQRHRKVSDNCTLDHDESHLFGWTTEWKQQELLLCRTNFSWILTWRVASLCFSLRFKESSRLWNYTSKANETFRKTREKTKGMGKKRR